MQGGGWFGAACCRGGCRGQWEGRVLMWCYVRRGNRLRKTMFFVFFYIRFEFFPVTNPSSPTDSSRAHSQLKTAGWEHTGAAGRTFKSLHLRNER